MKLIKKIEQKFDAVTTALWAKFQNPTFSKRFGIAMMAFGAVLLGAKIATAFNAPAAGSFAYTVYDVAINHMLNGPIGFVGGVAAMALGAIMAIQQRITLAIPCILGGAALLNAESMVTTLGMTF